MADDEGTPRDAGQSTDAPVTVIIDPSTITLTGDEKAANDAMRAEITADIQADEDVGSSIFDNIIDPPDNFLNHPDYDPEDHAKWIRSSYDHRVYYGTSAPLVDSPMIMVKQIIELYAGRTNNIGSCLRFELHFGPNAEAYQMDYDHAHTWARANMQRRSFLQED
eukprot:8248251-Pyramimonas_sp.AAC.1